MAWRIREFGSSIQELEHELLGKVHLKSSSITTITLYFHKNCKISVFVQVKSGQIIGYSFDNDKFTFLPKLTISCGTFTFHRMNSIENYDGEMILAYPSPDEKMQLMF